MSALRLLILAIVFFCFAALPLRAEDGSRVILVLDASGSMRAKIDGKSKIDIAKEVVGNILKTWKPADELGLIAYGHREKGNCKDIEVLREPGTLDAADFMSAVNGLNPKGQTPMTAAVKMAAESLQFTEKKATVILVSDGIETCGLDPCAVAEDLAKMGVDLKVHTVGFGLDNKGAVAQLKCLAEKTGGTYTTANNATELQKALAKTVAPPPPAPVPAAPAIKFNVLGHVKQTATIELTKPYSEAAWTFRKADGADGTEGAYVNEEYNADMKTNLEPGDYIAKVKAGRAIVDVPFKVEAGKVTHIEADEEAGIVKLSGMIDDHTPLADKGASWDLHSAAGKYIDTQYGASQEFMLNAGDYVVELSLGEVKVKSNFTIKAGEVTTQVVSMGAGKVSVSAAFGPGGPALENGMSFEIYQPGEEANKLGAWVNTQYNAQSTFDLPAGNYIAVVKIGIAEARQNIIVAPGSNQQVKIDANAGFIAAKAEGATSYEIRDGKQALDGSNKWITTTYDPALNIAANAGSYLIIAFKGDTKIGEKLVDVKAAQRSEITLP